MSEWWFWHKRNLHDFGTARKQSHIWQRCPAITLTSRFFSAFLASRASCVARPEIRSHNHYDTHASHSGSTEKIWKIFFSVFSSRPSHETSKTKKKILILITLRDRFPVLLQGTPGANNPKMSSLLIALFALPPRSTFFCFFFYTFPRCLSNSATSAKRGPQQQIGKKIFQSDFYPPKCTDNPATAPENDAPRYVLANAVRFSVGNCRFKWDFR